MNSRLRTKNRRVYAIGDVVAGGPRFTHWGSYQAGLVLRSILFRFGGKARPDILPWVTFTEPELAHVGLGEAEARRRYGKISTPALAVLGERPRLAGRATRGLVKLVVTAQRPRCRSGYSRAGGGRAHRTARHGRGRRDRRQKPRDRRLSLSDALGCHCAARRCRITRGSAIHHGSAG